jgi:hypothetical protein
LQNINHAKGWADYMLRNHKALSKRVTGQLLIMNDPLRRLGQGRAPARAPA